MSKQIDGLCKVSRIFYAGCAAWVLGKPVKMKIRGTADQVTALGEALTASREFHAELMKEGTTVDSVMAKLEAKRSAATEFHRVCGVPWPL